MRLRTAFDSSDILSTLSWRERLGNRFYSWPLVPVILLLDSAFKSPSQGTTAIYIPGGLVLSISRYRGNTIDELGLEEDISIVKHAILERNYNKL